MKIQIIIILKISTSKISVQCIKLCPILYLCYKIVYSALIFNKIIPIVIIWIFFSVTAVIFFTGF